MQTALIVFFIAFVASRYILLNALKKLTEEEKASLLSSKIITQSQTRLLIVFGVLAFIILPSLHIPDTQSNCWLAFLF